MSDIGGTFVQRVVFTGDAAPLVQSIQQIASESASAIQRMRAEVAGGGIGAAQPAEIQQYARQAQQEIENTIARARLALQRAQGAGLQPGGAIGDVQAASREARTTLSGAVGDVQGLGGAYAGVALGSNFEAAGSANRFVRAEEARILSAERIAQMEADAAEVVEGTVPKIIAGEAAIATGLTVAGEEATTMARGIADARKAAIRQIGLLSARNSLVFPDTAGASQEELNTLIGELKVIDSQRVVVNREQLKLEQLASGQLIEKEIANARIKVSTLEEVGATDELTELKVQAVVLQREQNARIRALADERLGVGGAGEGGGGGGLLSRLFGGQISGLAGAVIGGGAAFAVFGGLRSAVEYSLQLSKALADVQARLNAIGQGDQFNALRDNVLALARASGESAVEIATVAVQFTAAFGTLHDGVAATQSAIELARIGGQSLKESSQELLAIAKSYGVVGTQLGTINDALFQSASRYGITVGELSKGVATLAQSGQFAGFTFQQLSELLGKVAQVSQTDASGAAERLTRVLPLIDSKANQLIALSQQDRTLGAVLSPEDFAGADSASNVLKILGTNFNTFSDQVKASLLSILASGRGTQSLLPIFENFNQIMQNSAEDVGKAGSAQDAYNKQQATLSDSLKRLREDFNQLGNAFAQAGVFTLLDGMVHNIEQLVNYFGEFNRILDGVPAKIAEIAIGFKALEVILARMRGEQVAGAVVSSGASAAEGVAGGATGGLLGRLLGKGAAADTGVGAVGADGLLTSSALEGGAGITAATAATGVGLVGLAGVALYVAIRQLGEQAKKSADEAAAKLRGSSDEIVKAQAERGQSEVQQIVASIIPGRGAKSQQIVQQQNQAKEELRRRSVIDPLIAQASIEALNPTSGTGAGTDNDLQNLLNVANGQVKVSDKDVSNYKSAADGLIKKFGSSNEIVNAHKKQIIDAITSGQVKSVDDLLRILNSPTDVQQANIDELAQLAAENAPESQKTPEDVIADYQAGATSSSEYLAALKRGYSVDKRLADANVQRSTNLKAAAGFLKQINDFQTAQAEQANQLADILESSTSTDPTVAAKDSVQRKVDLLTGPAALNDPAERTKVATDIYAAEKSILDAEAARADSAGAAAEILARGIKVPDAARAVVLAQEIAVTNQAFMEALSAATQGDTDLMNQILRAYASYKVAGDTTYDALSKAINDINKAALDVYNSSLQFATLAAGSGAPFAVTPPKLIDIPPPTAVTDTTPIPGDTVYDPQAQAEKEKQSAADKISKDKELRNAEAALAAAKAQGDAIKVAQVEIDKANQERRDAEEQLAAAGNDASLQTDARAAELNAEADQIKADRSMQDALEKLTESELNLVKARLEANGDVVGASKEQVEIIKQELSAALAAGVTGAPINDLQAQLIGAQADVLRTGTSFTEQQIQDNLDLKRITVAQAVQQLRALEALQTNQHDRDDIEKKVRALLQQTDQSYNIPSGFVTPGLYEIRRTQGQGSLAAYQDNRRIDVQLAINNGWDETQVRQFLGDLFTGQSQVLTAATRSY